MSWNTAPVSVAMCTFNGAPFVRAQLESIREQTLQPGELVVCDDGSTDATIEIVRDFSASAKFPVHLHLSDRRLGSTKNFERAIRLCKFDFIFLADQDDLWHSSKVEKMMAAFHEQAEGGGTVALVFSDGEVVDPGTNPLGRRLWSSFSFGPFQQRKVNSGRALEVLLKHNVVTGATMAFRSEFRSLVLPFPSVGYHDSWIALLIASVSRLCALNEPLISYRHHERNQVGAAARTVGWAVTAASRPASSVYEQASQQFIHAAERLASWKGREAGDEAISELRSRAEFLDFRAQLPRHRSARLARVGKALVSGKYQRYAMGFRSAASDLWRPE